jgi:arsenite-transporting ATPase
VVAFVPFAADAGKDQIVNILGDPTRYVFFTGKGGVGKTSLACATAVSLADAGKSVLLVSTDPASNLDQVLGTSLSRLPTAVAAVPRLAAMNIDPEEAARAYRERALAPLLGIASEPEFRHLEEQLSGACTVEIAAFDEFTGLLDGSGIGTDVDHVIFDTAPTGHTLRLLRLPAAWESFIDVNPGGASCLGPRANLESQRLRYESAVQALADPALTTFVLVTRPEGGALTEAARTSAELADLRMCNQRLVVNGVFTATDRDDEIAVALERRGRAALAAMPAALRELPRSTVPLRPFNVVGIDAVRAFLSDAASIRAAVGVPLFQGNTALPSLAALVDDLAIGERGLVMVMGKGGVGKTTIATAIAVELAARDKRVHLTTTDPAAHVAETVEGTVANLRVSRIDPKEETRLYTQRVLATRSRGLDAEGLALLEEDLKSPCTEEVAVFHAFARVIGRARSEYVVIDTAPTGHTLLLLDTTGAYHHEVMRSLQQQDGVSGAVTPLMRLRDATLARMVIVTLPETTPVQEASQLQDDLRRAEIEPYAWVVNASFAATGTRDPLLRARAAQETEQVARVRDELASRAYLVPWLPEEPVGPERLRRLAGGTFDRMLSVR